MSAVQTSGRFVVQRHQARSLHFDFRLEKDGVFKSWAVPKGLPEEPGLQRLAIGDFEGQIPAGQRSAGMIQRWDYGCYALQEWTDTRIAFALFGKRYAGQFSLERFERGGAGGCLPRKIKAAQ